VALFAHEEIGEWLARAAALEAASVPAFRILAGELRAHDAPSVLVEEALRSAEDETRHARVMHSLARRFGAVSAHVELEPRQVRSLEAIAVENAIEGGVRERYGAQVALLQAQRASDAEMRAVFAAIAPDELRHAELAAAVDRWARERLPMHARRRVDEARAIAIAELARASDEPAQALRATLGLPDATRAQELIAALG
jgi:rubrerythrin